MSASLITALASVAALAGAQEYTGSPAEKAARQQGLRVLGELWADVDGDYKNELAIVERGKDKKLRVVVMEMDVVEDEVRYTRILSSSGRRADRVIRFESRQLVGHRSPELLAVFEERSPDESVQHVRIVSKTDRGLAEVFSQTFYIPRRQLNAVSFGDATPRFEVTDLDDSGDEDAEMEVVWVREPQVIELRDGKSPTKLVIGAVKQVFRYNAEQRQFLAADEPAVEDFMPPKLEWEVEASQQVPKIWGTAQAFWGTDGDLDTSWNIPLKSAVGQTIDVRFEKPEKIGLVRVVPGCASNADSWDAHGTIMALSIRTSRGFRLSVDLEHLEDADGQLKAAGVYPLEEGFGQQVLLLLERAEPAEWVQVTIDRIAKPTAAKRLRVREVCMAELSFH